MYKIKSFTIKKQYCNIIEKFQTKNNIVIKKELYYLYNKYKDLIIVNKYIILNGNFTYKKEAVKCFY